MFYQQVPTNFWYSFYRPRKDKRLSQPWRDPVVLNTGPPDWESSSLIARPLPLKVFYVKRIFFVAKNVAVRILRTNQLKLTHMQLERCVVFVDTDINSILCSFWLLKRRCNQKSTLLAVKQQACLNMYGLFVGPRRQTVNHVPISNALEFA